MEGTSASHTVDRISENVRLKINKQHGSKKLTEPKWSVDKDKWTGAVSRPVKLKDG